MIESTATSGPTVADVQRPGGAARVIETRHRLCTSNLVVRADHTEEQQG